MRCQCLTSSFLRRYVGKCGVHVVVKVRHSSVLRGLFASVLCLSENLIPLMLLSIWSLACILLFSYSRYVFLCVFGT